MLGLNKGINLLQIAFQTLDYTVNFPLFCYIQISIPLYLFLYLLYLLLKLFFLPTTSY